MDIIRILGAGVLFVTLILLIIALFKSRSSSLGNLVSLLGTVVSSLTLVWVVHSQNLQLSSLDDQKKILDREVLELQPHLALIIKKVFYEEYKDYEQYFDKRYKELDNKKIFNLKTDFEFPEKEKKEEELSELFLKASNLDTYKKLYKEKDGGIKTITLSLILINSGIDIYNLSIDPKIGKERISPMFFFNMKIDHSSKKENNKLKIDIPFSYFEKKSSPLIIKISGTNKLGKIKKYDIIFNVDKNKFKELSNLYSKNIKSITDKKIIHLLYRPTIIEQSISYEIKPDDKGI